MPSEIQIPAFVTTGLQLLLAFGGAFFIALWISLIVWTFRDMRSRSRDIFAIILATLMVTIFGPLGLLIYFLLRPPVTLAELYERSLEEEALLQDLEERPRCPGCSRQIKDEWILCPDCHTTLKKICPNCREGLHLNWNVCPFCGTHVATLPADDHIHEDTIVETPPIAEVTVDTRPVEAQEVTAEVTAREFASQQTMPQEVTPQLELVEPPSSQDTIPTTPITDSVDTDDPPPEVA